MVFVHSRKDTGKTARQLAEIAGREGDGALFDVRDHERCGSVDIYDLGGAPQGEGLGVCALLGGWFPTPHHCHQTRGPFFLFITSRYNFAVKDVSKSRQVKSLKLVRG